jgi:hypothetical protein
MTHRQQKLPLVLRITAAGCIGLWLLASSYCGIEHLLSDDHHHAGADASATFAHHDGDHSPEAEAAENAHGEGSDSPDSAAHHSHDAHPHDDGDDACCSTLMATAHFATPFVISKPLFQPLGLIFPVRQTLDLMLSAPKDELERQAKPREWVFTPQVCLGPAFRSLAPPSLA